MMLDNITDSLVEKIAPPLANSLYLAALPFVAANMYRKFLKSGKYARSGPGMLTMDAPSRKLSCDVFRCWMHSVSVGESVAAGAFFKRLKAEKPDWDYLVTTTTETGQGQAKKSLQGADRFAFSPFDFTPVIDRFHRIYRPSLYCFFETEIWPNHLLYLRRHGVPTFLVNGKLSGSSTKWYARASPLFRPVLSGVTKFYMQSERDAERLERIIGPSSKIEVAGNIKFDALPEPLTSDERSELRKLWGVAEDEILVVAGSTHDNEETLILDSIKLALKENPRIRLAIAPRHPERFDEVCKLITDRNIPIRRTSEIGSGLKTTDLDSTMKPVIVIDEMGVLARWYGAGEIAIVGGAWNPIGGHNLLEPAIHGVPVIRGPHMHAQPEIVRVLSPAKGGLKVSANKLPFAITELSNSESKRKQIGENAKLAAQSAKGSAGRVVSDMLEQLAEHKARV